MSLNTSWVELNCPSVVGPGLCLCCMFISLTVMFVGPLPLCKCFVLICIDLKSLPAIVVSHPNCLPSSCTSSPVFPHQGSQWFREDTLGRSCCECVSACLYRCVCVCEMLSAAMSLINPGQIKLGQGTVDSEQEKHKQLMITVCCKN